MHKNKDESNFNETLQRMNRPKAQIDGPAGFFEVSGHLKYGNAAQQNKSIGDTQDVINTDAKDTLI